MKQAPYLPHLSDPLRRDIAANYIQLELRKFFPHLRNEESWHSIDSDISNWYELNPTLAPMRDFWNGFHAISMGFKLKNVLPWLTSLHMEWQERELRIDSLLFGDTFEELERIGRKVTVRAVRDWYFIEEHKDVLEKTRTAFVERGNVATLPDRIPIIVVRKNHKLVVVDGNRRVLRSLLCNEAKIRAYVAEPIHELDIYEQWVPTSFLLDLTELHRYYSHKARTVTDSIAGCIAEFIRDSSAGRYEWVHRCLKSIHDSDFVLWTTTVNILKQYGVTLDVIP